MPNLQALTTAEAMRVHQAEGYAWGRMDAEDGPFQTPNASAIAHDFGIYVHDVAPNQTIPDAWATFYDAGGDPLTS